MNKQEAIKELANIANGTGWVTYKSACNIVEQINGQQKPLVPKFVIDYYERYKDKFSCFEDWFGYDIFDLRGDFPQIIKVNGWLYANDDNDTNCQRELALATLIVNGIEAVEVEKEKLYTVELPDPNRKGINRIYLGKSNTDSKVFINKGNFNPDKNKNLWLTEEEIKQDFDWAWKFRKEVKNTQ